jgi:endonuclease III
MRPNLYIEERSNMPALPRLLDQLEAHYGPQSPVWPTDPYLFLVWWHCGYPASDASCAKGWYSLKRGIGVEPNKILAASTARLTAALKPGGMVADVRALRIKEIADRVLEEFGGDLAAALRNLPVPKARAALKTFPGIADPGADRILLFGGISPVAAIPSNLPQVAVRMLRGRESDNYGRNYRDAQDLIAAETPEDFAARTRAYLLLKTHGQQLCKRLNPKCSACPIQRSCAFTSSPAKSWPDPSR